LPDEDDVGLAINLIGPPSVHQDGVERAAPRGHKSWAILALLLLSAQSPSRQLLASLLFAEADDPLGALRWNLARLRALLGPRVTLHGDPVVLNLPADTLIDVRVIASGTWVDAVALPGLGREMLEGIQPDASPAFDAWLLAERRRVAGLAAAVLREAATARLAAAESRSAVELATRLVAMDEFDEEAQALLIRAHIAAGNGTEARRYLSATIARFQHELGVEPSATLKRSADRVMTDGAGNEATTRSGAPRGQPSNASIASLIAAGEAAVGAGAVEAGLETLRRAASEARDVGDDRLLGQALVALGEAYVHGIRGRDGEGATSLHAALNVAERSGANGVVSEAARELGYVEMLRARYDRADTWLERALAEAPDRGLRAAAMSVLGSVMSDRGSTAEAITILNETTRDARALGKPRLAAWAYAFLARTHFIRMEYEAAHAAAVSALESVAAANWMTFKPFPQAWLASVEFVQGNIDTASSLFESAFAVGCQIGDPCWEGMGARGIGLVHLARGNVDDGIGWLDDARTRCVRIPDAYLWIHAFCLDSLCQAGIDHHVPETLRWISDLESLAARTGMSEMLVRAFLHRAASGDVSAVESARLFKERIDNPAVLARIDSALAFATA
jgi:DNA-binding SARP family transcriptional activator